ncbi:hypothetical protein N7493_011484 [Penicillium malachiteum]|uniref:Glutathione S-transferase UstS-like C-terminal domain-containing protein n=1 Tax=Penicillium malachiteum TaxID=1324776 RepID=A0AAD6HAU4_9EURO|nr:hypothetical protein N7493_011484 [Penicillium malachiteum]
MSTLSPIEYDMATRPPMRFNCYSASSWKSRLALNFKKLPYSSSWVHRIKVPQALRPLDVSTTRRFEDGSNYHTLAIVVDPSTNAKLGGSFQIATYLQEIYPTSGAGDLFPPQDLDFGLNKDRAVSESPAERMDTRYEEYFKFNTAVDAAFTFHASLMNYQIRFDPGMTDENKADFVRHASVSSSADFDVKGKEREKLKKSLWIMMGDLARLFLRDTSGPFLLGQQATYADIIVGAWLRMMSVKLPGNEWKEVKGWHLGVFGNLHDALEEFAEVQVD